ncbi:MAG: T9SS type A sorting domain-containing protein [Cyclobacteriaceae bacterium]|nr:T9SS type A sorting domain-containing protein [Cyclobacteriaceae bacterium HetDA_MAG_MS6]
MAQDVSISFPTDAGVIDVTQSPYNADKTGNVDATTAIQQAIDDYPNRNKIIYLPNGTYKVSNTIYWAPSSNLNANNHKRTILQGQSKTGTTIQLKNNCSGFTNPSSPKWMIWTGKAPAQNFRNAIRNLTINTGNGNAGAIGVEFYASNQGSMRHVRIISGDGSGHVGLDLNKGELGPELIYDVLIDGFDTGIDINALNSVTLEKVEVRNQNVLGIKNASYLASFYDITSVNSVRAFDNGGTAVLVDANLSGGTSTVSAIKNTGSLFARDIATSGYKRAILNNSGTQQNAEGANVSEFVSHNPDGLFSNSGSSLRLPVEDIPDVPWDNPSSWGDPRDFGAPYNGVDDDGPAIQACIDAGFTTVFLANTKFEKWTLNSPVYLRNNLRRFIGAEAAIRNQTGKFVFQNGTHPVVWLERIDALQSEIKLEHQSSRTLVASSCSDMDVRMTGSGKLHLVDYVGADLIIDNPSARVWGRQLNLEAKDVSVDVRNGTLWVLGYKTENAQNLAGGDSQRRFVCQAGTKTEILGGSIYNVSRNSINEPVIDLNNCDASFAGFRNIHFISPPNQYPHWVRERQGSTTKTLALDQNMQLYVAESNPVSYPRIHSFSNEQSGNPASNILDGNTGDGSRWSANGFPQWVIIDYGSNQSISSTQIWTYQDRAYQFKVDLSTDLDFTGDQVVNRLSNTSSSQPISNSFSSVNARYARITVEGASGYGGSWVSLTEFTINGSSNARTFDESVVKAETAKVPGLSVYPNPTSDRLNMRFSVQSQQEVGIRLVDMMGREVRSRKYNAAPGENKAELKLTGLVKGIYLIKLSVQGKVLSEQVVIE